MNFAITRHLLKCFRQMRPIGFSVPAPMDLLSRLHLANAESNDAGRQRGQICRRLRCSGIACQTVERGGRVDELIVRKRLFALPETVAPSARGGKIAFLNLAFAGARAAAEVNSTWSR